MFLFNMRTTFSSHCTMIKIPRASTHAKEKEYKQENNVPETGEMILLRAAMPRNERKMWTVSLTISFFINAEVVTRRRETFPGRSKQGRGFPT